MRAIQAVPTAEDVLRLADAGQCFELVDGELVEMSPTSFLHGEIENLVGRRFGDDVERRNLGKVVTGEVLFQLDRSAAISRAADVAFVRRDRLPRQRNVSGAFEGAPDLAVEIVSPSNTAEQLQRKIRDWLTYGAVAVLVMFPSIPSVVLWRANGAVELQGDDLLDLDPALPGFRCPVRDLFPPPLDFAGEPTNEGVGT